MDKDYKGLLLVDLLRPCMFYRSLFMYKLWPTKAMSRDR